MKTKLVGILVFALSVLTTACKESYFDQFPEDQLTEAVFYKGAKDFELAVNAAYLSLRPTYRNYYAIGDIASDDAYNWKNNNFFDYISLNESNVAADNGVLTTQWNTAYATIARTNIVLGRIDGVQMEEALKSQYKGEARFLRALAYFNLVRIFGDVPLVTSEIKTPEEAFAAGREKTETVYNFIVSDLKEAEVSLPEAYRSNADLGRATRFAAKSLLGKVYLTRHQYSEAVASLREVISANKYGLLKDYARIFDPNTPNQEEILFAVQYARNSNPVQGSGFGNDVAPNEPVNKQVLTAGSGFGRFHLTTDFIRSVDKRDKRLSMVDSATSAQRKYYFTRKYFDPSMTRSEDAANDWIILRYADVLLMASEALNEASGASSEALAYLNQVRERAGLAPVSPAVSKDELRVIIGGERRTELNSEGHRWFDLVRTGRAVEVLNTHFAAYASDAHQVGQNASLKEYELLFPLPVSQVMLNPEKIKQNNGY